jgi:hypothetical protein
MPTIPAWIVVAFLVVTLTAVAMLASTGWKLPGAYASGTLTVRTGGRQDVIVPGKNIAGAAAAKHLLAAKYIIHHLERGDSPNGRVPDAAAAMVHLASAQYACVRPDHWQDAVLRLMPKDFPTPRAMLLKLRDALTEAEAVDVDEQVSQWLHPEHTSGVPLLARP